MAARGNELDITGVLVGDRLDEQPQTDTPTTPAVRLDVVLIAHPDYLPDAADASPPGGEEAATGASAAPGAAAQAAGPASARRTDAIRRALADAVDRATAVASIARRVQIPPDELLALLDAGLDRSGVPRDPAHPFTDAERVALDSAGVDLAGPAAPAAEIRTIMATAAHFRRGLSVAEAAQRLGVSQGRVRQRLQERTLHGVRPAPGAPWRLPPWQFTEDGALPGLGIVLAAAGAEVNPLALERLMTAPSPELDDHGRAVSPVDWLAAGGDPRVVAGLVLPPHYAA